MGWVVASSVGGLAVGVAWQRERRASKRTVLALGFTDGTGRPVNTHQYGPYGEPEHGYAVPPAKPARKVQ